MKTVLTNRVHKNTVIFPSSEIQPSSVTYGADLAIRLKPPYNLGGVIESALQAFVRQIKCYLWYGVKHAVQ